MYSKYNKENTFKIQNISGKSIYSENTLLYINDENNEKERNNAKNIIRIVLPLITAFIPNALQSGSSTTSP